MSNGVAKLGISFGLLRGWLREPKGDLVIPDWIWRKSLKGHIRAGNSQLPPRG